jgi:hypothetical protein
MINRTCAGRREQREIAFRVNSYRANLIRICQGNARAYSIRNTKEKT